MAFTILLFIENIEIKPDAPTSIPIKPNPEPVNSKLTVKIAVNILPV